MTTLRHFDATIAAIATPPGPGGIGIIRISGSAALPTLKRLFRPSRPRTAFQSHRLYHGWIMDPLSGDPLDEVLAVYMRAPNTYTREDIVEIHCHGSFLVLQDILAQVLAGEDARLAEPGEFTKRAFLNGRIDLTQAEAVIELLQAKTREGLHMAMAQLRGGLHSRIKTIRDTLLSVRAIIEVAIDFPEEDTDILQPEELRQRILEGAVGPLRELIASSGQGRIFRDGISVVILGRPNVGKSSLLNSLLEEERAIVTALPGTTRDTIEEYLDIKGMPVRIIDTAGIREAAGAVEEMGIKRSRQKMAEADLVLLLFDGAAGLQAEDRSLYESVAGKTVILVVNKMDIAPGKVLDEYRRAFPGKPLVAVSAKKHEGLSELEETLFSAVTKGMHWDPGLSSVPNVRQEAALSNAMAAAQRVAAGLETNLPPDLLAVELQAALDHLGSIVGETTAEDVLDMIFEQFCIGK